MHNLFAKIPLTISRKVTNEGSTWKKAVKVSVELHFPTERGFHRLEGSLGCR